MDDGVLNAGQFDSLLTLAGSDPAAAARSTEAILDADPSPTDRARALRARGLAHANLGEVERARFDLDAALTAAIEADETVLIGETQMARSAVLAWSGDPAMSLDAMNAAYELLDGRERAVAQAQRGAIHYRLGNFSLARIDLDQAIASLDTSDDHLWRNHALSSRGLLNADEGRMVEAGADLVAAKSGYVASGHPGAGANASQDLAWLALRSGDFPAALNFLDEAEEAFADLGESLGGIWSRRAETLLAARLSADAKEIAAQAAAEFRDSGLDTRYADALIQAAQAALLAGDAATAADTAARGRVLMEMQGRRGWIAFADYLALRASTADGGSGPGDSQAIDKTIAALEAAGLQTEALHARLVSADAAARAGDSEAYRIQLAMAATARRAGPAELRAQGWLALARLRLDEGDRRGAAAAARAGLRILAAYRAVLGGAMARLHLTGPAAELAGIGLRMALDSGSPRRIFGWMELSRAHAMPTHVGTRGRDQVAASQLLSFRNADEELRRAVLNGDATAELANRHLDLQEELRGHTPVAASSPSSGTSSASDVLARLGEASLVEFGDDGDGNLIAVTLAAGRARKFDLGSTAPIRRELDSLSIALRRTATGNGSEAARAAAAAVVAESAANLDALLIDPLRLESESVVVVPTGRLFSVPWSLLPSLARTHLVVTPSAAMWADRSQVARHKRTGPVTVIAGPRLAHSALEVDRVAGVYQQAVELLEPTAGTAARAIDGAAIVHIACHGSFRADNPLFSSLEMQDGPLTVYDLEALEVAPTILVLSACDAGANAATGGHEVMGFATAVLALGTRSVVANVGLVPDQLATIELMVRVHTELRSGFDIAGALTRSFPDLDYSDPDSVAARGFVTFGV